MDKNIQQPIERFDVVTEYAHGGEPYQDIGPVLNGSYMRYEDHVKAIAALSQQHNVEDYEETLEDHRRLTRELDVLLNGEEGAAKQASLCDIVAQVRGQKRKQPSVEDERDHGDTVLRIQEQLGITRTGWVSPDVILLRIQQLQSAALSPAAGHQEESFADAGSLADLWIHEDMAWLAADAAVNAPRKELVAAHKQAVEERLYWERRALEGEAKHRAPTSAAGQVFDRNAALEEAAQVAEYQYKSTDGDSVIENVNIAMRNAASAIRELKHSPTVTSAAGQPKIEILRTQRDELAKQVGELTHSDSGMRIMRLTMERDELLKKLAGQQAIPEELRKIGELLTTQENRATDQPLFIVQQKRTYVTECDYNDCRYEWRETESGEYIEADPVRASHLEAVYRKRHEEPKGWKRFAVFDVWEFVTACFTEQGCKDYIDIDGHNLKEPRIYAEGSYRNQEFRLIRNWLMSLSAAPTPEGGV